MAELQHDRTLGQTATQSFASDGGDLLAAAAVVSIRLWLDRPDQPPGDIFRDPLNPAVCLATDTLVASGGTLIQGQRSHCDFFRCFHRNPGSAALAMGV